MTPLAPTVSYRLSWEEAQVSLSYFGLWFFVFLFFFLLEIIITPFIWRILSILQNTSILIILFDLNSLQ